jgi:hypothetical protein
MQASWAEWGEFNSTTIASFPELLVAQRVRRCFFEILISRGARKRGQNFDIYLLAPQRLATNREK